MAELGDYLGHILCEITRARVRADFEALRVAKEYAGDEAKLLRHFPVPRMRLPTVEIMVPIQINDIPDGFVEKTSADTSLLSKVLVEELGPILKMHNLRITISDIMKVIKEDPDLSKGRLIEGWADSLSVKIYDHTKPLSSRKSVDAVPASKPSPGKTFNEVSSAIRDKINEAISNLPRQPVGITVETRTSMLREVGDTALLFNCKLVISENALDIHLEDEETVNAASSTDEGPILKSPQVTKPKPPRIKWLVPE